MEGFARWTKKQIARWLPSLTNPLGVRIRFIHGKVRQWWQNPNTSNKKWRNHSLFDPANKLARPPPTLSSQGEARRQRAWKSSLTFERRQKLLWLSPCAQANIINFPLCGRHSVCCDLSAMNKTLMHFQQTLRQAKDFLFSYQAIIKTFLQQLMIPCQVRHVIKDDREDKLTPKPLKQGRVFSFKNPPAIIDLLRVLTLCVHHFSNVNTSYWHSNCNKVCS